MGSASDAFGFQCSTACHEWFRKLSSQSLQGIGKIYTVFLARLSEGMCGAAAKADIRLLSESNVGTKMHLSVMTANLLPASAGKEASPCLCVWGCCVWFPSDKNNADCPLCHLVAGKVVEVANEIHRRSGIYLNRCQSAYPGSNLRQQSFHLYLFPWQSYSLP